MPELVPLIPELVSFVPEADDVDDSKAALLVVDAESEPRGVVESATGEVVELEADEEKESLCVSHH